MLFGAKDRTGPVLLGIAFGALALAGCSKQASNDEAAKAPETAPTEAAAAAPAAPAAAPSAAAPAADNVDTLSGAKFADFTGDATKGATEFVACKACHAIEEGVNKIGPSLHNVVGRVAGSIAGYTYSPANKNSGITWTPEKLFQYLEKPARIVPGTKMTYPGQPDPQKRADLIAYLKAN